MADGQNDLPVRAALRPVGTGLPLGLLSFALGMVVLGAQDVGWVPPAEQPTVGLFFIGYVFPLEFLAAVMIFLGRDSVAATALGLFSGFWLAEGLAHFYGVPGGTSVALGIFGVAFGLVIACEAVIAAPAKPLISVVLTISALRAVVAGSYQITAIDAIEMVGGVGALALAVAAGYAGIAFLMEAARPRAVLPTFRRGEGKRAKQGSLAPPPGLASEPGVREQL